MVEGVSESDLARPPDPRCWCDANNSVHADAESADLVVIGSGPGGYVAAIKAAQLGMKVSHQSVWLPNPSESSCVCA